MSANGWRSRIDDGQRLEIVVSSGEGELNPGGLNGILGKIRNAETPVFLGQDVFIAKTERILEVGADFVEPTVVFAGCVEGRLLFGHEGRMSSCGIDVEEFEPGLGLRSGSVVNGRHDDDVLFGNEVVSGDKIVGTGDEKRSRAARCRVHSVQVNGALGIVAGSRRSGEVRLEKIENIAVSVIHEGALRFAPRLEVGDAGLREVSRREIDGGGIELHVARDPLGFEEEGVGDLERVGFFDRTASVGIAAAITALIAADVPVWAASGREMHLGNGRAALREFGLAADAAVDVVAATSFGLRRAASILAARGRNRSVAVAAELALVAAGRRCVGAVVAAVFLVGANGAVHLQFDLVSNDVAVVIVGVVVFLDDGLKSGMFVGRGMIIIIIF